MVSIQYLHAFSLYAAGISPHEVRYHFADISSVVRERISLKKQVLRLFFLVPAGRPSGHPTVRSVNFIKQAVFYAGQPGTASGRNAPPSLSFVKPLRAAAEQIQLTRGIAVIPLTLLTAGAPPRYPRRLAAPRGLRRFVAACPRFARALRLASLAAFARSLRSLAFIHPNYTIPPKKSQRKRSKTLDKIRCLW